jgi:phosphoserine phosphatase RsbU/P
MIEDAVFEEHRLTLEPGDRLYLYTDGVIEALNAAETEFGADGLCAAIELQRARPLRTGIETIVSGVRNWCGGRQLDDLSLLAIERLGG